MEKELRADRFDSSKDSAPAGSVVVEVSSATVSFGGEYALRPTSMVVKEGEAVVIRGPSGAGKSTLLRVIAGLLEPVSGNAALWGGSHSVKGRQIGITLDEPRLWPWMSAVRTVICLAGLNGVKLSRKQSTGLLEELNLSDAANTKASQLSQGMARRVQLAGALAVGTDLLLLDEPTASLDAENRAIVWRCLERRRLAGVPIVAASHDDSWHGFLETSDVIELSES